MRLTDLSRRLRRNLALCFLVLGCALSGVSCGYYHMGSMMHPQIKTIAISTIRNDTREPLLTELARTQIAARFQSDNSLKLVSKEEADCILYVRLVSVSNSMRRYKPSYEDAGEGHSKMPCSSLAPSNWHQNQTCAGEQKPIVSSHRSITTGRG